MNLHSLKDNKHLKRVLLVLFAVSLAIGCLLFILDKNKTNTTTVLINEREERLCAILSEIDGVGKIDAFVNEEEGVVTGVILVFEGADSLSVRLDVLKAAAVALGISQKDVTIYRMTK